MVAPGTARGSLRERRTSEEPQQSCLLSQHGTVKQLFVHTAHGHAERCDPRGDPTAGRAASSNTATRKAVQNAKLTAPQVFQVPAALYARASRARGVCSAAATRS